MREVAISLFNKDVYVIVFYDERGLAVGKWPTNHAAMAEFVSDWLQFGKRPI